MKAVIQIAEGSAFQNVSKVVKQTIQIRKPNLIIGRGVDLLQIEDEQMDYFDLSSFGKSISRKHAKICFPLSYFNSQFHSTPSYYLKFDAKWKILPKEILQTIRDYAKSPNHIKVINLKSKYGLYSSISSTEIREEEYLQFGNFTFHLRNRQLFNSKNDFFHYIESVEENQVQPQQKIILGQCQDNKPISVMEANFQNNSKNQTAYFIGQNDQIFTIGRLGTCDLQINRSQLSRKQGILVFSAKEKNWVYKDGSQTKKSTNGSWQKKEIIEESLNKVNKDGLVMKLGEVEVIVRVEYDEFTETSNILSILEEDNLTCF